MGIATYTDFRARLAGYMEKVCDDRASRTSHVTMPARSLCSRRKNTRA